MYVVVGLARLGSPHRVWKSLQHWWPVCLLCSHSFQFCYEGSLVIKTGNVSPHQGRVQLKCDGTRWRTGREVKRKLANGVGSQYPSHYLWTWCIKHYYRWCRTPRLPVWIAQTLDRCDKAQCRLHWRTVNVFCKINPFLQRKRSVRRTFEIIHVFYACWLANHIS